MKKKIWKDYWNIWRFRQISAAWKNQHDFSSVWVPVYLLVLLPCLWLERMGRAGVIYYSYMIPVIAGYFTARWVPMGLPKVLYLVPMTAEDRKRYVTGMYWMKVAVPPVFSLAWMLTATVFSLIDWYELLFGILMQFLLSMGVQLAGSMLTPEQKKGKLKYATTWAAVAGCFGWICLALMPLWIAGGEMKPVVYRWILAGIVCCQLLLTVKCMGYYGALIDSCMFYENIIGKNGNAGRAYH